MGNAERKFRIVTYPSKTNTTPTACELPLEHIYTLLQNEEVDCVMPDGITPGCRGKKNKKDPCPNKDGFSWSPGYIRAGTRGNRNVELVEIAVFDIDDITWQQLEGLCERLVGLEAFLHSTHTHLWKPPPANVNVRLVLPLASAVTPDEWKALWFAIQREFGFEADKGTKDPSRLSFTPRSPKGVKFINVEQSGVLLDPKPLLLRNMLRSRDAAPAPSQLSAEEGSFDRGEVMDLLRGYNGGREDHDGEKKAMVRRVAAGEAFVEQGRRGKSVTVLGGILGRLLPLGTPIEMVLEMIRPSLAAAMLPDDNEDEDGIEPWSGTIAKYYKDAQEKKLEELEADTSANAQLNAHIYRAAEAKKKAALALVPPIVPADPPSPLVLAAAAASTAPTEDPEAWRLSKDFLKMKPDAQGNVAVKNTSANIDFILEHHPSWKGTLRYNALSNEPELNGGPLSATERTPQRLMTSIRNWLARRGGIELPLSEVVSQVEHVAQAQPYDPLQEYLTRLVWDGTPRIHDWLIRYLRARCETDDGKSVESYVRRIGKKWLMAGAARGLYPGCKADNVLVLEGEEYVGKSKCLDILGGGWFADIAVRVGDKDSLELASKKWIIELSELASVKKSETEAQKRFFSARHDNFRLSYGRRVGQFDRRCIFAGTTNETKYLVSDTGNRRFWSALVTFLDAPALRRDRDQLWAEAVAIVRAGEGCPNCSSIEERCAEHRWWLDANETREGEEVATTRLKAEYAEQIRDWWLDREPGARKEYLTTHFVMSEVLKFTDDKHDAYQNAVGRSLKSIGFERVQRDDGNGVRRRVYVPSEKLKNEPRRSSEIPTAAKAAAGGAEAPAAPISPLLHLINFKK